VSHTYGSSQGGLFHLSWTDCGSSHTCEPWTVGWLGYGDHGGWWSPQGALGGQELVLEWLGDWDRGNPQDWHTKRWSGDGRLELQNSWNGS